MVGFKVSGGGTDGSAGFRGLNHLLEVFLGVCLYAGVLVCVVVGGAGSNWFIGGSSGRSCEGVNGVSWVFMIFPCFHFYLWMDCSLGCFIGLCWRLFSFLFWLNVCFWSLVLGVNF